MQLFFWGGWTSVHYAPGERPAVVLARHNLTVSPGTAEHDNVATLGAGHTVTFDKHIATLTNGADDVVGLFAALSSDGCGEVFRLVKTAVHGRPHKVGHSGIDDDELLVDALFDVQHPGNKTATLCHHGTTELEMQLLPRFEMQQTFEGGEIALEIGDGMRLGIVVVDAQASADVKGTDTDAFTAQGVGEGVDAMAERLEGSESGNLASDMEMKTDEANTFQRLCPTNDGKHRLGGNAELVLVESRGNLLVGVGIDVGIDAKGHRGHLAHLKGDGVDYIKFLYTFDIEGCDAALKGCTDFPVALAYSSKDDIRRPETLFYGTGNFAPAHAISTKTGGRNPAEDGGSGAGLDSIVDVERRGVGYGATDGLEGAGKQGRIVMIEWGPKVFCMR